MMLILIVLGMFMDWIGILLLTMPIFVPIVVGFGMDPVWFGILFCMSMQVSLPVAALRPGRLLPEGGGAAGNLAAADLQRLLALHRLQIVGLAIVVLQSVDRTLVAAAHQRPLTEDDDGVQSGRPA